MTAKLIFSDIDGTLITSDGNVSSNTIDAIRKQIIAGSLFIPVSARTPKGIMNVVDKIANFCPTIAHNGVLMLDETGGPLNSQLFDAAEAVQLITKLDAPKTEDPAWNTYSSYNWLSPLNKSPLVKKEKEVAGVRPLPVSLNRIKELKGIHKMLIIGRPDTIDKITPTLQSSFPKLAFVRSTPHLLEVMLASAWAFGDNYNDKPMLETIGHPILMGNVPEELKKKLNIPVTLDNDHDGITAVLNKMPN